MLENEQKLFPKQDFWASLEATPYLATVHFDSLEIMNSIELPDLVHVERPDKYRFTEALLTEIDSAVANLDHAAASLNSGMPN